MKKFMKNIFRNTTAAFGLITLFSACQIGLGSAVDLQAPEIHLESHKDNDSVASQFVLYGYASDNDTVSSITIDFEDADIHYQITPGENWYKETETSKTDYRNGSISSPWVEQPEADNCRCYNDNGKWRWFVEVNTSDKCGTKSGNNYSFKIVVTDKTGNSGKLSKTECSLIVDTNDPCVSIYKPELFSGTYASVESTTSSYALKDGNVINRLINGTITLTGRQSDALSFKAMRVQFDNGKNQSDKRVTTAAGSASSIDEIDAVADLEDEENPVVYFSKTIESTDLREWSMTIKPEEWSVNEDGVSHGLNTGKHIIRVVTTSLSSSNAWEKKVIGYFVWWPESDTPWITTAAGDDTAKTTDIYECYPGSNFTGSAQDDDAIESLVSTLYKQNESTGAWEVYSAEDYTNPKTHTLPSDGAKYSAWSVKVPAENGKFMLTTEVEDEYGNKTSLSKYFKTSDVSAPKITISSPADNSSAIVDASGNIKFTGTASDNGKLASFSMVWLNSAKSSDPTNKIKYLTGEDSDWDNAAAAGWSDKSGNKIYLLYGAGATSTYTLEKTFNLYTDFGVDGENIPLSSQEFIFRAVDDSGTKSVKTITLTGDSITPDLGFTDITIDGDTKTFTDGTTSTAFKKIKNGTTATITGTWSDNFTSDIENTDKISSIVITWGSKTKTATIDKTNKKWSVEIAAPSSGGTITASILDFGGNTKTVQAAASIETSDLGLSRVDCLDDDGAYKAGKTLSLTLEFTKNTDCDTSGGIPTLTLNNGGIATFKTSGNPEGRGSGTTSHIYEYEITSSSTDTDDLTVTKINANGAKWFDSAASTSQLTVTADDIPTGENLGDTRSIIIDNTAPRVSSITALSGTGYYKAGSSVLLMLEFSEDVTITNPENLAVKFAHTNNGSSVQAGTPSVTGSKYVLFTYDVTSGENANPLTFSSIVNDSVTVKDNAGNDISNWTPVTTPSFAGRIIDTAVPEKPSFGSWNPDSVIFDDDGTEFTLSNNGETDIESMEYSFDGGTNWTPYTTTVSIPNNGKYTVVARQTDYAGNTSEWTDEKTLAIDKGALLTRITADTVNGTYSTSTETNVIEGRLVFRKEVTIEKGATVTLNVLNGTHTTYKTCPINECVSADATNTEFTFTYTIELGDYVTDDDGYLDVTDWSFDTVNVKEHNFNAAIDVSSLETSQKFDTNRNIKIVTGIPAVSSVTQTGVDEDAVLTITFDRDITKVGGSIVMEYNTDSNAFHVPAVLSAADYAELKLTFASQSPAVDISSYYTAGTNGATVSGTELVNDSSTKYILNTSVSDTNSTLVTAFKTAGKHKVTVPVISDQVEVSEDNSKVLVVNLGTTYPVPVKGAVYTVTVPAGAVTDDVSNKNEAYTNKAVTAAGVEAPEIRIVKPSYLISGVGTTASASVDMTDVQTAKMYLSCRTPDAVISYGLNTLESDPVYITGNPIVEAKTGNFVDTTTFTTKTTQATIPTVNTTYSSAVELGGSYTVESFKETTGIKIAIKATAANKSGTTTSAAAYEYATRSALKLFLKQHRTRNSTDTTSITENSTTLTFGDLAVWISGGDSSSGPNSTTTFPLAWADPAKFKMMQGGHTINGTKTGNMHGEWWWVSWDITAATYFGFNVGDVPSDANTAGPTTWYLADYFWTLIKSQYPLYPGETLVMCALGNCGNITGGYETSDKTYDYETVALYYYVPYFATFEFNKSKMETR